MQRILQLTQTKEFREGKNSLIKHVIFPLPLFSYIEKPYTRDSLTPDFNISSMSKRVPDFWH